jgi:hypothetical protein
MGRFTRRFTGRGRPRDARLPPGQYDTERSWPVLTAEATPKLDVGAWTFTIAVAGMAHLLVSARRPADLIYTNELDG